METGSMNWVITIQKLTGARDEQTGQKLEDTWQNIPSRPQVFAAQWDNSGSEMFQSDKQTASSDKVFKIHYRSDLSEEMTVLFKGRRHDITRIEQIGMRRGLKLHTTWTQGKYDE